MSEQGWPRASPKLQEQQSSCSSGEDQEHWGTARGLHTSEILTEPVWHGCSMPVCFWQKVLESPTFISIFVLKELQQNEACLLVGRNGVTKSVWILLESLGQHKLAPAAPKVADGHFPVSAHLWNSPKVCLSEEMAKSLMSTPSFQRSRGSWHWLDETRLGVHAHCWNGLFQKGTISV